MSRVYVLYTGGTIGSAGDPLAPISTVDFAALVARMPGLAGGQVASHGISYVIAGTAEPLDSSNMAPSDWVAIARQIAAVYAEYDGFVVLHGTDTMAFTASALSFMFSGLSKPIVVTGSQLPLSFTLNDALTNLIGAMLIAGSSQIPEVTLYFDFQLLRGNRSAKVNANAVAAFASPNFPPLATVGAEMTIQSNLVLPPPSPETTLDHPANLTALMASLSALRSAVAEVSVGVLVLYPGIGAGAVRAMLQSTAPPMRGLVLEAFGEGNGPSDPEFLAVLSAATADGVVLMDNTQVLAGAVNSGAYATGSGLASAGALSAYDMTPESSLAKLVTLLGSGLSNQAVRTAMQQSLRGELTPPVKPARTIALCASLARV